MRNYTIAMSIRRRVRSSCCVGDRRRTGRATSSRAASRRSPRSPLLDADKGAVSTPTEAGHRGTSPSPEPSSDAPAVTDAPARCSRAGCRQPSHGPADPLAQPRRRDGPERRTTWLACDERLPFLHRLPHRAGLPGAGGGRGGGVADAPDRRGAACPRPRGALAPTAGTRDRVRDRMRTAVVVAVRPPHRDRRGERTRRGELNAAPRPLGDVLSGLGSPTVPASSGGRCGRPGST